MNKNNLDKKLSILNSKEQKLEKKYNNIKDTSEISKEIEDFIEYCLKERQENHAYPKYTVKLSRRIMRWGEVYK